MMVAEELAEALDIVPDERVLDVACGSGNGAVAAARRAWGNTVGADFVPALLERGRERAAAERLEVEFVEGEAAGAALRRRRVRRRDVDLRRDVRRPTRSRPPRSCCASASPAAGSGWPTGCRTAPVGEMFMTIAKHVPPPPGVPRRRSSGAPRSALRELLRRRRSPTCGSERRTSRQAFRSADHFLEFFRTYFGPTKMAFERVGPEGEAGADGGPAQRYLEETQHWPANPRVMRARSRQYLQVGAPTRDRS